MKPWRPYWKHLEQILDSLLKDAGPAPFGQLSDSARWIGELPYIQLVSCDGLFQDMIDALDRESQPKPIQIFEGADIRWQMILRIECGLCFCRGHLWKRKEFDWSKSSPEVYRWLLIDLWYRDAIYWASRSFDLELGRRSMLAEDIRSRLWQLERPEDIQAN